MRCLSTFLTVAATYLIGISAFSLNDGSSIQGTASVLAKTLMSYYNPADAGVLPQPYYWWEAGGMWGGMLNYWHYTGDATYNDMISKAILAQAGPTNDFMGPLTDVRTRSKTYPERCMLTPAGK